jgi:hypothetical protein
MDSTVSHARPFWFFLYRRQLARFAHRAGSRVPVLESVVVGTIIADRPPHRSVRAPGASTQEATGTFPTSITDNGVIVGYYSGTDGSTNGTHGFQLTP